MNNACIYSHGNRAVLMDITFWITIGSCTVNALVRKERLFIICDYIVPSIIVRPHIM